MKRGSRFLIAFIASALTFGSLMAFVGPQRSGWNRYGHGYGGGWRHHHHYNHYYDENDHSFADSSAKNF